MAGNWKMYKTSRETREYLERFRPLVEKTTDREIVLCPTFVNLAAAVDAAANSRIEIGAQNLFWAKEGAYTGEISADMLVSVGCKWVLIGHSERRQYFQETDEGVFKKTEAALAAGLKPVVCIGETLAEREANQTFAVLERQIRDSAGKLTPGQFSQIVIAYEPVWAIGTGKTATPEIAQEAHQFIRQTAEQCFNAASANALRILYGGSVKPGNVKALMSQPDIDGVLVGGASLDPADFAAIVNF
jgi:triosephosphate isomerase